MIVQLTEMTPETEEETGRLGKRA